jgi:hypothetical protein
MPISDRTVIRKGARILRDNQRIEYRKEGTTIKDLSSHIEYFILEEDLPFENLVRLIQLDNIVRWTEKPYQGDNK